MLVINHVPGRPGWEMGEVTVEPDTQLLRCAVWHARGRTGLWAYAKTESALRDAAVAVVDEFYDRRAKELPPADEYVRLV